MKEYWGSGYGPLGGSGGGGGTIVVATTLDPLLAGSIVSFTSSANTVVLADADITISPSRYDICGVSLVAAAAGTMTPIVTGMGQLTAPIFVAPPLVTDNGKRVWLSTAPGFATVTPLGNGNWAQSFVGILQGADGVTTTPKVLFQPRLVAVLR